MMAAADLQCHEQLASPVSADPKKEEELWFQKEIGEQQPVKAVKDLTILHDNRVLQNLLQLEESCMPTCRDYLRTVQPDLSPSMRKIVCDWMLQVCQDCGCSPDVFMLAVNYMDRFLAKVHGVPKSRLQLIGSVCLLISSKFKETVPVPGERIIFYTDFSISAEEIRVRFRFIF
jgi:hypothetical protein